MEDLTGIRERTNQQPRSKTERRRSNSEAYGPLARGAFYQLRTFIAYKALKEGVRVVLVNPRYTSHTCHKCLHIHPDPDQSYRSGKRFKCGHCGWEGDADYNSANMIALLGAVVNQPHAKRGASHEVRGWLANYRATKSQHSMRQHEWRVVC